MPSLLFGVAAHHPVFHEKKLKLFLQLRIQTDPFINCLQKILAVAAFFTKMISGVDNAELRGGLDILLGEKIIAVSSRNDRDLFLVIGAKSRANAPGNIGIRHGDTLG